VQAAISMTFENSMAQTNWTWVSSASATNQPGVYGTKGVAAATKTPGAQSDGGTWTDRAGNLWLFGGYDLRKFEPLL
jgi:hypothetical protein